MIQNKSKNNVNVNKLDAKIKIFVTKYYLYISFILIFVVSSRLSPLFLNPINIINVLLQNSIFTIIAIGQLFVILTGGIDLSVGSIVALCASLVAGFLIGGMSPALAILIVIIVAGIIGSISGIIVSYGKIAPFIVTLSMMSITRGIAYIYQIGADRRIYNMDFINGVAGQIKFLPLPVIYMFLIALLMGFILWRTVFGRTIYAIGGNMETCRLAGIKVNFFLISAYTISGIMAGIGGLILAARLNMGTALVGQGYELDAIASVVVGGAPLTGGSGTVFNTVIGAFIIGILNNIMNLLGVAAYPQMIVKGFIILVAVLARSEK